jgi:hypothetical protein
MVAVSETGAVGPTLLFHSGPTDFAAALAHAQANPGTGVVLSGSEISDLVRLREGVPTMPLFVDGGGWTGATASVERPFSTSATDDALFEFSMADYLTNHADAGATRVLTPTLTIGNREWIPVLEEVFREFDRSATQSTTISFLPLQAGILDERNLEVLVRRLTSFGRPVGIAVVGSKDAMAALNRLVTLRSLISQGLVQFVFATEPLVASDAVAYGASVVSVGVNSGLRVPSMPSKGGLQSSGFLPGLFFRTLLELRNPDVLAGWYAGSSEPPRCSTCGRLLTIFDAFNKADKLAIVRHNLHGFADFHAEVAELAPADRRGWLAQERYNALSLHPQIASGTAASKILTRLVDLDGLQPEPALEQPVPN